MKLQIQSSEDAEKYFNQAVAYHQKGQLDAAIELYIALLQFFPEFSLLHYNLGHALSDLGQHDTALEHYIYAHKYSPEDEDILFNLAHCHKTNLQFQQAIALYKSLLKQNQDNLDALYNLANTYKDIDEFSKAIETYKALLLKDEKHKSAVNNLAFLLHKQGLEEDAIHYYKRLLDLDSDNVSARHMLAALTGEKVTNAPKDYIQTVFDNYSANYENSLVEKLQYRVPQKIKQALAEMDLLPIPESNILDLGCGSGLGAEQFTGYNHHFTGIDLSSKMLDLAASKNIYDQLFCEDIVTFLEKNTQQYQFILAADVLTYIGELEPIFRELHGNTTDKGLFVFSTEHCEESFTLRKSGRFAHSPEYLRNITQNTGWSIIHSFVTELRKEREEWISGEITFAQRI